MEKKEIKLFVPGRICLFGEHSDWAAEYQKENKNIQNGYAIVSTLNLGIYATILKCDKFKFVYQDKKIELDPNKNLNCDDEFFAYTLATASYMYEHYKVGGISIVIDKMTLPMKKGLASSACICILVVRAFSSLYNLKLNKKQEMEIAYLSERKALSKCGRMDQICAYNHKTMLIEFVNQNIKLQEIKLKKNMYLSCAVFNRQKNTKLILDTLNQSYPYPKNKEDEKIQKTFGYYNIKTIKKALSALKNGNYKRVGNLMYQVQNRFDKYVAYHCKELEAPFFHELYKDKNIKSLILGMKLLGAGGDGSCIFLLKNKTKQNKLKKYLNEKYKIETYNFTIK